jgi:protein TonB
MKALLFIGHRNLRIVASVLLLHVLALWAFQSGLLQRAVESLVAVQVISDVVEAPSVKEVPRAVPMPRAMTPQPAPQPVPIPAPLVATEPVPARSAESPVTVFSMPAPAAPSPGPAPLTTAAAGAGAGVRIDLPSSDAEYLHNPKAPYPLMSLRRNEQGRVVVEVLIGVDGVAQKAQIKESSGYARLDQQALATVLSWRYVPGKRGGVPQAMTYSVPINFVLE